MGRIGRFAVLVVVLGLLSAPSGARGPLDWETVPEGRLAVGYGAKSDGKINAPPYWGKASWLVMGSGGQVSTTGDTGRFLTAMREGRELEITVRPNPR